MYALSHLSLTGDKNKVEAVNIVYFVKSYFHYWVSCLYCISK